MGATMGNPADERTVINVKSVRVEAWNMARKAATQRGVSMGEWLSLAIVTQVRVQEGDAVQPPDYSATMAKLTEAVQTLGPALGSMETLTRDARSSISQLLDTYARAALGVLPRRRRGKADSQSTLEIGQSKLIELPAPEPDED
jgi:hypothetical protein